MESKKNKVIGGVETGIDETQVEVIFCQRDGKDVVMLQLSTWHETLGWQIQKTIPLSANKIGQLQRLLSETRNHLAALNDPYSGGQVLDFTVRGSRRQTPLGTSQPTTQNDDQAISAIN